MDATWQRLGDAAGRRRRREPCARRAGKAPMPPHSHGASEGSTSCSGAPGSLAGRRRCTRSGRATGHPPRQRARAHLRRRSRRPRLPRLRHAAPDGFRLAAAVRRRPARLAVDRGPNRRSLGPRGGGAAARVRRARRAAAEHPQRRRGRARALGAATTAPLATKERSDQAGFHWERLVRAAGARCRTAIPRRRRSSSSSKARERSSSGRRRRLPQGRAPRRRRCRFDPAT